MVGIYVNLVLHFEVLKISNTLERVRWWGGDNADASKCQRCSRSSPQWAAFAGQAMWFQRLMGFLTGGPAEAEMHPPAPVPCRRLLINSAHASKYSRSSHV